MIGATTENPFFSVTPAIRSRVQIFELEPLSNLDVKEAIQIALTNPERGFDFPVELDDDALDFIATSTNGDLRSAFNSLDLAVLSTPENDDGVRHITLDIIFWGGENCQIKRIKGRPEVSIGRCCDKIKGVII